MGLMYLWHKIKSRRSVLFGIGLAALLLRLWGLSWGQGPDPWEWPLKAAESMLGGSLFAYDGWGFAFIALSTQLKLLLSNLVGLTAMWLGFAHSVAEAEIPMLWMGRFVCALAGVGTVLMVYRLGRMLFSGEVTALLAAAFVAFNPVLVAQAHFFELFTPLGLLFVISLYFWARFSLEEPSRGQAFAAGLATGLCSSMHPLGLWAMLLIPVGLWLGWREVRPMGNRLFKAWLLMVLLGFAIGLLAGAPFLVRGLPFDRPWGGDWPAIWLESWQGVRDGILAYSGLWFNGGGLATAMISVLGLFYCWQEGRIKALALIGPVLIMAPLGLMAGPANPEAWLGFWYPPLSLAAAWALVKLCRNLPSYRVQLAAVCVAGGAFVALPLWSSLAAGYVFWQIPTQASAETWLRESLPRGAGLSLGPDMGFVNRENTRSYLPGQELPFEPDSYILLDRRDDQKLAGRQIIKQFDLLQGQTAPSAYLRRSNPPLSLYSSLQGLKIRQPLALYKVGAGLAAGKGVCYLEQDSYGPDFKSFLLGGPGVAGRTLKSPGRLEGMGVQVVNLGEDLVMARLKQGPWSRQSLSLFPGQEVQLMVPARRWPFMTPGVYPFKVELKKGSELLVRLEPSPLVAGRRALEAGAYPQAMALLRRQAELQDGFDCQAMLAASYARLGRMEDAGRILATLEAVHGDPPVGYVLLARGGEGWQKRLEEYTGYHHSLLAESLGRGYDLSGQGCPRSASETALKGSGYHGVCKGGVEDEAGLRLWLDSPWPGGEFHLSLNFAPAGRKDMVSQAEVSLWGRRGGEKVFLARAGKLLLLDETAVFELPFVLRGDGHRLELELDFKGEEAPRLTGLEVRADLNAHFRKMLRWYWEAKGRVMLATKRYRQAAEALESARELGFEDEDILMPLCHAMVDSGRLDDAKVIADRLSMVAWQRPGILAGVAEIYALLGDKAADDRLQARLSTLRPSLKKEAHFKGGLALLGYDLNHTQVARGDQLEITYYWQADRRPLSDFFIFVHLAGQGEDLNFDHLLQDKMGVMRAMQAGEVIRDKRVLRIPDDAAPGEYDLVVGMWDPRYTGKRLPIISGDAEGLDQIILTKIKVLP